LTTKVEPQPNKNSPQPINPKKTGDERPAKQLQQPTHRVFEIPEHGRS